MIRAIHVEDEERNISLLQNLIAKYCTKTVQLLGAAKNIDAAIALIKKEKPDVVFLDIQLEDGNSFQMLDLIKDINFSIIFMTAFDEYAIKAFKYNAIDYLLKPIDSDELIAAVNRVIKNKSTQNTNQNLQDVFTRLQVGNKQQKLALKEKDGSLFITIDDIISAEAKGSYTLINMVNNKTITTTYNLKEFHALLPQTDFLRIHKTYILHVKYLKKYVNGRNGYVIMDDDSTLPVSIRKKGKFMENNF